MPDTETTIYAASAQSGRPEIPSSAKLSYRPIELGKCEIMEISLYVTERWRAIFFPDRYPAKNGGGFLLPVGRPEKRRLALYEAGLLFRETRSLITKV